MRHARGRCRRIGLSGPGPTRCPDWPDWPGTDRSATCVEPLPLCLAQPTTAPSTSEPNAITNSIVHVVRAWNRASIACTIGVWAAELGH